MIQILVKSRVLKGMLLVVLSVASVAAQSGRVQTDGPTAESTPKPPVVAAEQLFAEARDYYRVKVAEFQAKKIPYDDKLELQTQQEQRELAAKNAAILVARPTLATDDLYFLGRLHWLASNPDGASEAFLKLVATENANGAYKQTARSILIIIGARRGKFEDAEKLLVEYLNNNPVGAGERLDIESEFAKAYRAVPDLAKAAPHSEEAYRAAKNLFAKQTSRNRGLNDIFDAGVKSFEIYRAANRVADAERMLDDMRKTASFLESPGMYYTAVSERIRLMIETGRKPDALKFYKDVLAKAPEEFLAKPSQADIVRRLKRREIHYKLLGEPVPELPDVAEWFGEPKKLADLRGKVVVLDFWATWCGPCIAAFPSLRDWNKKYAKDGLVILGVTGYTGSVQGEQATEPQELEFLRGFKKEHQLEYDFVIGRNFDNQELFGASSIPTTIIIDRKGVVRYAEIGSGREADIEREILRLLAEK